MLSDLVDSDEPLGLGSNPVGFSLDLVGLIFQGSLVNGWNLQRVSLEKDFNYMV